MIPHPVPPLRGVTVLVTRPAAQAAKLCGLIRSAGGDVFEYPTIAIEPIAVETTPNDTRFDWLIFTSVNAVQHGLAQCNRDESTRVAAIGNATAAALKEREVRVDATPTMGSTSEDLLTHPSFERIDGQRVLIIKGVGGREQLQVALAARGGQVSVAEVYRRVRPEMPLARTQQLEAQWRDNGIDVVTLTSVETLDNLLAMLTDEGKEMLRSTPFVAISERISSTARAHGLTGDCMLSRAADDESIVGAIAAWHTRAR